MTDVLTEPSRPGTQVWIHGIAVVFFTGAGFALGATVFFTGADFFTVLVAVFAGAGADFLKSAFTCIVCVRVREYDDWDTAGPDLTPNFVRVPSS